MILRIIGTKQIKYYISSFSKTKKRGKNKGFIQEVFYNFWRILTNFWHFNLRMNTVKGQDLQIIFNHLLKTYFKLQQLLQICEI